MRSVAVVVQPGFAPFEFGLACEAFGLDRTDDGVPSFDFRIVSPDPGVVPSNIGFSINVERGLDAAEDADILVLAPIPRERWGAVDVRVLDLVRRVHARGAWLLSVCSGSFVLADSGVLDGRRATTHWRYAPLMARMYPRIEVDPDVLYVQSENIITSAGTAAGLDACLHLLRQELGAELTNRIARRMVVAPQRDGGQAQFIASPLPVDTSLSLAPVTEWMLQNLDADLPVERLAARAHMSPRTFARRFKADFGATPAAWLARQRLLHAQRLLEETDLGLDRIAAECGFGSAAVLRQNFARTMGLTPTAYRARFSCADDVVAASREAIPA
ncbi:helix-turn-helix domain-containing protein [Microbacterium sp. 5K110]|jgi:transcriptional regulator GlxA family with amidase domain|uniref:GlxA family transcriptional regulator n=1 Tax=unclassified Microbacterium TaxID=2609290 RepID=UPI0010FE4C07|nr:helix-turn-helix domain-containing protein [Microbacterium sp. 5K110]TLF32012.1 helix-turn-helix domain-containing protein [Microbacterium sp. 5K110]